LALLPILFGAYRLARWQKPHAWAVTFSPDGRLIATSYYVYNELSDDDYGYFEVRSLATGKRLMQTHQESTVGPLALSPDGRIVAAGHADGSIHLQNLETGAPIAVYHPTDGFQSSLCFGRDGKTLVGASRTGLVLLDVDTGRQIAGLESTEHMYKAAFTADHERLVVLAYEKESRTREFRIYDVGENKLEEIAVIPDPNGRLAWSPDATRLAVADGSQVHLWSIEENTVTGRLRTGRVYAIAFSPDASTIATTGRLRGVVDLWDVRTGKLTGTLACPGDTVSQLAYSPDGAILAAAGGDETTTVWDVAATRRLAVFSGQRSTLLCLWGLLGAFLVWCILWVWSGTRSVAKWRPAWDVALLNCLVLGALTLRMFVVGGIGAIWRTPFPLALGLLASLLSLLVLWMMLGGLRWSLRVPGFLAGAAVIWTVPLVIWGRSNVANFEIALGAVSLLGCLILSLKTIQYFGVRIVHTIDDEKRVLGGESVGQLPLKDALLWTAATALLFAVARLLSPELLSLGDLMRLITVGVFLAVSATAGIVSALGRHPLWYVPFACVVAAAGAWTASAVCSNLSLRWSMCLQLSTVTMTIGSLLVFRVHGYRLRKTEA